MPFIDSFLSLILKNLFNGFGGDTR